MRNTEVDSVAPWRVVLAVAVSVAAMVLQWHFSDFFTPYVGALSYPALIASVLIGGLWGGLLSTAAWTGVIYYVFMAPELSIRVNNPDNLVAIAVFVIMGLTLSLMENHLRKYRAKVKSALLSEVEEAQSSVIVALARIAESRDGSTGRHLGAVQALCVKIAEALRDDPGFDEPVSPEFIRSLAQASVLHDIGKVGIPDDILLKPGRLNDREYDVVKTHTQIGWEILENVHQAHPTNASIEMAMEVVKYHHERWDGHGYPEGLSGTDIPLAARIMAVADVYEALRSQRCYKDAIDHENAVETVSAGAGTQFDPSVVRAFLSHSEDLRHLWAEADQHDFVTPLTVSYSEPEVIRRALRDLEAIRLTDRAMIEADNKIDFAQRVCEICVKSTGYSLAWVGRPMEDKIRSIKPIAWAGKQSEYLASADIRWSDEPQGSGPAGTAVKTGKPVVVRSTDTDEVFAPWREQALLHNLRSVVALPLLGSDQQTIGVLTVYSNHENAFDSGEIELLSELADELAYGFTALENRTQADWYHALWVNARDSVLFVDATSGSIIEANLAAEKLYGYSRSQILSMTIFELRSPAARELAKGHMASASEGGILFETEHVKADGTAIPVEVSSGPVEFNGKTALVSVVRDISERYEAREALRTSEAQFRLITDMIADVVVRLDENHLVSWVSPSLKTALGWSPAEWVGRPLTDFFASVDGSDEPVLNLAEQGVRRGDLIRYRAKSADGQLHWIEVNAVPHLNDDGVIIGEVASFRLVDEQVSVEQELERRARYDFLTGVYNRGAMLEQTERIVHGHRRSGEEVALMFCDIDNLRDVNEVHGHAGGDTLLKAVATRIKLAIRSDDVVGRIGGDEFLVVLRGVQDLDSALMVAEKVRATVSAPLDSDFPGLQPFISVGVTLADDDEEIDAIIDRADRGLLRAKDVGRNKVVVVSSTDDTVSISSAPDADFTI